MDNGFLTWRGLADLRSLWHGPSASSIREGCIQVRSQSPRRHLTPPAPHRTTPYHSPYRCSSKNTPKSPLCFASDTHHPQFLLGVKRLKVKHRQCFQGSLRPNRSWGGYPLVTAPIKTHQQDPTPCDPIRLHLLGLAPGQVRASQRGPKSR